MNPAGELDLYMSDRSTWARHVAPRWLSMMRESDERKTYLWRIAGPELKREITALVQAEKVAA